MAGAAASSAHEHRQPAPACEGGARGWARVRAGTRAWRGPGGAGRRWRRVERPSHAEDAAVKQHDGFQLRAALGLDLNIESGGWGGGSSVALQRDAAGLLTTRVQFRVYT